MRRWSTAIGRCPKCCRTARCGRALVHHSRPSPPFTIDHKRRMPPPSRSCPPALTNRRCAPPRRGRRGLACRKRSHRPNHRPSHRHSPRRYRPPIRHRRSLRCVMVRCAVLRARGAACPRFYRRTERRTEPRPKRPDRRRTCGPLRLHRPAMGGMFPTSGRRRAPARRSPAPAIIRQRCRRTAPIQPATRTEILIHRRAGRSRCHPPCSTAARTARRKRQRTRRPMGSSQARPGRSLPRASPISAALRLRPATADSGRP